MNSSIIYFRISSCFIAFVFVVSANACINTFLVLWSIVPNEILKSFLLYQSRAFDTTELLIQHLYEHGLPRALGINSHRWWNTKWSSDSRWNLQMKLKKLPRNFEWILGERESLKCIIVQKIKNILETSKLCIIQKEHGLRMAYYACFYGVQIIGFMVCFLCL